MVIDAIEFMKQLPENEPDNCEIDYFHMDRFSYEKLHSCQGDLMIICNVMADYSKLLEEYLNSDLHHMDTLDRAHYAIYIERCRKIQRIFESQLGYSYVQTMEKCKKKLKKKDEGIGEDSLILLARKYEQEKLKEQAKEQTEGTAESKG